jgi:hypothetical protein
MKRLMCCLAVAAVWPSTAAVTARACDPWSTATYQSAPAISYQAGPSYTNWGGNGSSYRPYYRGYGYRSYYRGYGYRPYYGYRSGWGYRSYYRDGGYRFGWRGRY